MSWPSPSIIALVYATAACWAVSKLPHALHLTRALVLDLRHEGSHLAVGRVDACIARFATTSLEAKVAADLVVEVRVIA